jgi:hypothetical protein
MTETIKCFLCGKGIPGPPGLSPDDVQALIGMGGQFVCVACGDAEGLKAGRLKTRG